MVLGYREISCRIVTKGGPKPHLRKLAVSIFETCISNNIALEKEGLPKCKNDKADYISCIVDYDDWSLNSVLYRYLDFPGLSIC